MTRSDLTSSSSSLPAVGGGLTLVDRLGAGGMAEVFLATRGTELDAERVVVKRMLPHLTDPQFKSMFQREAAIGARVVHPHVVRTIELLEDTGGPLLVLEYVDGWTLRNLARTAWQAQLEIPQPVLLRILVDCCEGLSAIHSVTDEQGNPFVHRDISPDNLMVGRDGVTKVLDFGVASPGEEMPLTRTGELRGKVAFMPPEQLESRPIDGRADLYALGITLFWMLCGRRPFADRSELALMQRIVTDKAPRVSTQSKSVDPVIDNIVARLLEKDRDRRFPSAIALRDALLSVGVASHQEVAALVTDLATHVVGGDPITNSSTADSPTQVSRPLRKKKTLTPALDDASEWQGVSLSIPTPMVRPQRRALWVGVVGVAALLIVGGRWALMTRDTVTIQDDDEITVHALPTVVETIPVPLPHILAEPADAVAPIVPTPMTRQLIIIGAPGSVRWSVPSYGDKELGHGSTTFAIPPDAKMVRARIAELDGVVDIPIATDNTVNWSALPRGDLSVRSLSQVAVFIGSRSFGTTPREDIPLVAGRYPVRIVHGDGREDIRQVDVTVGRIVLKVAP